MAGLTIISTQIVDIPSAQTVTGAKTLQNLTVTTNPLTLTVGQLAFPAAQNASADANTLDDYEEGTWTPQARGSGTAGTPTYTDQLGSYTKIGNRVYFDCYVSWSALTGSTGNLQISNLPFTSGATYYSGISVSPDSLTLNGAAYYLSAYIAPSGTTITLINTDGNGNTAVQPMDTSAGLVIGGFYKI